MRTNLVSISLSMVSVWAFVGCGGGESGGPPAKAGNVNKTGAAAVVTQTNSMQTALAQNNGAALSASVLSVGISGAQSIVTPGVSGALTASSSALTSEGPQGGTADCTETGCVYNMYKNANTTFNGSVKSSTTGGATKVTTDLTITQAEAPGVSGTIEWDITGELTFSNSTIVGKLRAEGNVSLSTGGRMITYDYFNLVDYKTLTLGTDGKATGGSLYAKWGVTVAGVPQGSQAWEGTATFP